MFGFQRRRVRRFECDTLLPKLGPLPQISHTDATFVLLDLLRLELAGARLASNACVAPIRNRFERETHGSRPQSEPESPCFRRE
jgi:hypothetical protein